MLGRQIFKSHFGKYYKFHFIKDAPVPRSLRPTAWTGPLRSKPASIPRA